MDRSSRDHSHEDGGHQGGLFKMLKTPEATPPTPLRPVRQLLLTVRHCGQSGAGQGPATGRLAPSTSTSPLRNDSAWHTVRSMRADGGARGTTWTALAERMGKLHCPGPLSPSPRPQPRRAASQQSIRSRSTPASRRADKSHFTFGCCVVHIVGGFPFSISSVDHRRRQAREQRQGFSTTQSINSSWRRRGMRLLR